MATTAAAAAGETFGKGTMVNISSIMLTKNLAFEGKITNGNGNSNSDSDSTNASNTKM